MVKRHLQGAPRKEQRIDPVVELFKNDNLGKSYR